MAQKLLTLDEVAGLLRVMFREEDLNDWVEAQFSADAERRGVVA